MFMKKVNELKNSYTSPQLMLYSVTAEQGFAVSDEMGYPGENPDFNDFGEF